MVRNALIIMTICLVAFTGGMLWITRGPAPDFGQLEPAAGDTGVGKAAIGGAFALTDQNGKQVKDTDFRGKLMLVFFGFTHCPDICPTTLSTLSGVVERLGESAKNVAVVLITVDPERDSPEVLKQYLKNFHPSITGLTGTTEALKAASNAYKVYSEKMDMPQAAHQADGAAHHDEHAGHGAPKNYLVNHSGLVYVMGKDGEYLTHFSTEDTEDKITNTLQSYLK